LAAVVGRSERLAELLEDTALARRVFGVVMGRVR
jgi:hypothetical protein